MPIDVFGKHLQLVGLLTTDRFVDPREEISPTLRRGIVIALVLVVLVMPFFKILATGPYERVRRFDLWFVGIAAFAGVAVLTLTTLDTVFSLSVNRGRLDHQLAELSRDLERGFDEEISLSIDQIENLVPNISINSGQTSVQIRIRGVGTASGGVAFDPGVGMYIDGVYMPRAQSAIFDTLDVESVEVLRGPQGSLNGRNATAGAIMINSVLPGDEFTFDTSFTYGNFNTIEAEGGITLPLIPDMLSARLSFTANFRDGITKNQCAGWDPTKFTNPATGCLP